MAGDIKLKYGTPLVLTQTNLDGIASSATWVAGWTSDDIDNTSVLAQDYIISGQFQVESAGLSAGVILVLAYASFNPTPTWPDVFSAGTEGTEGTATIHDTEIRDSAFVRLAAITTDTTASRIYPMAPVSIRDSFGQVPTHFAIFVAQSTGAALETTGDPNVLHAVPILSQYT
jgi:hypothetical protein